MTQPAEEAHPTLDESVAQLLEQGSTTTQAINALTAAVERQARIQRRALWAAAVILLAVLLVLVDNHRAIRALQARLCPLVTLSIHSPGQAPPVTPRGRDMEREAGKLARTFGCTLPAAANDER